MTSGFWFALLVVGLMQGAFLGLALVLKPTANRQATRALAGLSGALGLAFGAQLVVVNLTPELVLFGVALAINVELTFGPLVFLFVRALVHPDQGRDRPKLVHFLPFSLGLVAWLALAMAAHRMGIFTDGGRYAALVTVYVPIKTAILVSYLVAARRQVHRARRSSDRLIAGRRCVPIVWIDHGLLTLIAVDLFLLALFLLDAAGVWLPISSDQVGGLTMAALVYLFSTLAFLFPWLLSARPRGVAAARHADGARRLTDHLARDRPYLDAELTLGQLAASLGLSENHLSAVINEGLGTTFYALVAKHRLRHFERLALDRANWRRPVLDLAMDAGWNSKASFYRAFRDAHGTTPSAFRRACSV